MQGVQIETMPMPIMAKVTCGLDVHKDKIDACILINNGTEEGKAILKTFSTMRGALIELRDWILSFNCFNVLMESTGVYWMPIYFLLESITNMNVGLGNSYHMKSTPGRPKTDKEDSKWTARLCMLGFLLKSFIVGEPFRNLREYTRYYKKLVEESSRHKNRIEKLLQMNGFKLSSVLSDIFGASGLRILTILCNKGYLTVDDIRPALDSRVKSSAEEVAYAINGDMKPTSRVLLKHQLAKLEAHVKEMDKIYNYMLDLSKDYSRVIKIISSIPGIGKLSAIYIIAEIGTDFSSFKNSNYLTAWAGLAPKDNESADKQGPKKTYKANRYLKSIMVECAWAATRARGSRLSTWYWHNVNRLSQKKAITAVARKLLRYIYAMVQSDTLYDASLDGAEEDNIRARKLAAARKLVDSHNKRSELIKRAESLEQRANTSVDSIIASLQSTSGNGGEDQTSNESPPPKKRGRPPKKPVETVNLLNSQSLADR